MLQYVDWQRVTDVSKELSDSFIRVKRSTTPLGMLDLNSSNVQLNPIYHLLALLGAHHILHVSRIRVKGEDTAIP